MMIMMTLELIAQLGACQFIVIFIVFKQNNKRPTVKHGVRAD